MFKKFIYAVLVVLTLTLTSSIAKADEERSLRGSPDETYYMVVMVSGVEYWVGCYEGMKQAAKQLGVKVVYTGTPDYDISKELTVFQQVLSKNPAGIIVHPMEPSSFIDPINQAVEQGVAVVTMAADSPESNRNAYVTSDNVKEGYAAADAIARKLGEKGDVAVLENPGQLNHEIRVRSFVERIENKYPNMKVVARTATNQDTSKSYSAVQTMLQAHPNIKGIFTPEASSGQGAAQAAIDLDQGIQVICCDFNENILDMIQDGKMFAALQPNTVMQGYLSMMLAYMARHNLVDPMNGWKETGLKSVDIPIVDNGLNIITKDNADFFRTKKYLESRGSKGTAE